MAVWKYVAFIVQLTTFILLKIGSKQVTQHLMSQCFSLKIIIECIIPLDCLENWINDTQKETCTICHELLLPHISLLKILTLKFNLLTWLLFMMSNKLQRSRSMRLCNYFPYFVQETQNLNTKKCSSKSENFSAYLFFKKVVIMV